MAEAPNPQGQSGAQGTEPDADGGADEPRYTEAAHQAAIKDRVKNLKKAIAAQEAKIRELEAKLAAQNRATDDDDEGDDDAAPAAPAPAAAPAPQSPSPAPQAAPQAAAPVKDKNLARLKKQNAELAESQRKLAEEKAKIEAELKASTLRTQAKDALAKYAYDNGCTIRDAEEVLKLTLGEFKLDESGNAVRAGEDGDEIPLDAFYADFFKRKQHHLTAPPAGTGQTPGGRPKRAPLDGRQAPDLIAEGLKDRFHPGAK